jgi:hypothetical protein
MELHMTTIFRESAMALGQIACQKLMIELFKEEEVVKPVVAKKDGPAPAAGPRWTRWTKTYTDIFKKSLTDHAVVCDEKEFDKLKKEFVKYLSDLTEEDYQKDAKTHPDRMNDFAELKMPKAVVAAVEDKVKTKAPKVAEEKPKTMWEQMKMDGAPTGPPSNAVTIHDIADLQALKGNTLLISVDGSPDDVFWDGKHGRWFQWPAHVEDEDLDEVKYNGVVYNVGKKSLRVYKDNDDGESHSFVGFLGIGMFHGMVVP